MFYSTVAPESGGRSPQFRVDDGYTEGMEVPIYYDPMLAKLVVHAPSRAEAIQLMKMAIADYEVEGVATTYPLAALYWTTRLS